MNAVIYARYSSDSQREESIEGQLRECREYAERNNMTIVGTYIDRALSAKTADRPEFQHMIKDSAKELFEIVLVWKLDRFSRDRYDSAHYKHILKKNGVKVATVYKGNIIKNLIMDCQSYTKYRPNETTGGIFVSWRRKEELPTGA